MPEESVHIAYAEDHVALRRSLIHLLTQMGDIAVDIEASNGRELIEKLGHCTNHPDVCLLDIGMPEMNGFETLVELKKQWPAMHVLVLSQHNLEQYIIRMISYGAGGYMLKDSEPEEIKTAILQMKNIGHYYSNLVPKRWADAIEHHQIKPIELTEMEKLILRHCCSDLSYEEIGKVLRTSKRSVEGHRDVLFKKLNVNSRVSLAIYAVRFGFVLL